VNAEAQTSMDFFQRPTPIEDHLTLNGPTSRIVHRAKQLAIIFDKNIAW
jgi:hypothetical protein